MPHRHVLEQEVQRQTEEQTGLNLVSSTGDGSWVQYGHSTKVGVEQHLSGWEWG